MNEWITRLFVGHPRLHRVCQQCHFEEISFRKIVHLWCTIGPMSTRRHNARGKEFFCPWSSLRGHNQIFEKCQVEILSSHFLNVWKCTLQWSTICPFILMLGEIHLLTYCKRKEYLMHCISKMHNKYNTLCSVKYEWCFGLWKGVINW